MGIIQNSQSFYIDRKENSAGLIRGSGFFFAPAFPGR